MSELDTELRGLRDELNRAIPLPDVDQLTDRAHARRQLQVAVVVVVIAVALAVPLLRWLPSSTPPAAPPASPKTTYVLDFADADHGYALARACQPGVAGCAFILYRTEDGGRTWTPRKLPTPPDPKTGYFSSALYVLGPDEVALDRGGGRDGWDRVHSTDGGRTWHDLTRWWNPENATAPLAPDAQLSGRCGVAPVVNTECQSIGAVQPDTGKFVAIPTEPPVDVEQFGSVAGTKGKWWTVGRSRTTGKMALAVTTDAGRTWSNTPITDDGSLGRWAVVARNGLMYAVASDSSTLLSVWRSTDDGKSWETTNDGSGGQPGLVGTPIAAADGTLIGSDGVTRYVSRDGGRTFRRDGTATGDVTWTRAGYLRTHGDEFALSADGLHWREFSVG
jgi:hypothetical protein